MEKDLGRNKNMFLLILVFLIVINGCAEKENNIYLTGFIAIHTEVDGVNQSKTPRTLDYQEKYWPTLVDLVELADSYDFKLTLEFTPQWASYILLDEERLNLARIWESNGHEIALHHHGPTHGDWDGYTNVDPEKTDARYIGDIEDMMKIMNQLPASGRIFTAGMTSEKMDWPRSIIYDTTGGEEKTDLLSIPKPVFWRELPVTQLRYRQYATRFYDSAELAEIESAYSYAKEDEIIGIVFHVFDYDEKQEKIKQLFESLNENDISIKTVKEILSK